MSLLLPTEEQLELDLSYTFPTADPLTKASGDWLSVPATINLDPRYCFRKDEDGHNYLIPVTLRAKFDYLITKLENLPDYLDEWYSLSDDFNHIFYEYRCDSPESYTFRDPLRE